jgi:uncharacterized membrane protein YkvI
VDWTTWLLFLVWLLLFYILSQLGIDELMAAFISFWAGWLVWYLLLRLIAYLLVSAEE